MEVGGWGELEEWMEEWENGEDEEGDVWEVWGVYGGGEMRGYNCGVVFEGGKKWVIGGGEEWRGWCMGWKVWVWGGVVEGNEGYKVIREEVEGRRDGVV